MPCAGGDWRRTLARLVFEWLPQECKNYSGIDLPVCPRFLPDEIQRLTRLRQFRERPTVRAGVSPSSSTADKNKPQESPMNVFVLRNAVHHSVKRISVLAAVLAASALAAQAQVVFSPSANVSHSPGSSPQVAVEKNGNINVVWFEVPSGGTVPDVFFSRSTDAGTTFSTPLDISPSVPASIREWPELVLDSSGNINVVWTNEFQAQQGGPFVVDVYYTRSSDGGASFSPPLNLSQDGSGAPAEAAPLAVDSSGNVFVVWEKDIMGTAANPSGSAEVRFSSSADGVHFSAPLTISNNNFGEVPLMALDSSGSVNVVYRGTIASTNNSDVFFTRSNDQGVTFSTPVDISNAATGEGIPASIAMDGNGGIYVMWDSGCGSCGTGMLLTVSKNAGSSFSASVNVPGVAGEAQQMAVDLAGNIGVFEYQSKYVSGDPLDGTAVYQYTGFFMRSTDGGATFSAPVQIGTSYNGMPAQMAFDSSGNINIAVALRSDSANTNKDLYLLRSTDGGATFSSTNVSNDGGYTTDYVYVPMIATDPSGNISLSWDDATAGSGHNIVYSHSILTLPASLSALGLNAGEVTGGSSATGTVTMNGAAPTGGTVVALSSSDPSVNVPATVTIPEGTTSTTFTMATSPVASATTAVITAAFGGVTQTASMAVEPPVLASLALNPSSVTGRNSSTGTVTLSGPAPAGGAVVALSSSNSSVATVPPSVTVPAGFTNATFTMNTRMVLCPKSATITGSLSAVSQTANLAVMPLATLTSQACSARGGRGRTLR